MKPIRLLGLLIIVVSTFLISCSGDDGKDGMDGIDGINGSNGQDGADGTNGVGFDELTRYGSATLELNGNRPDGVTIDYSATFKFTQTDGQTFASNILPLGEDVVLQFTRFYSSPDDYFNGTVKVSKGDSFDRRSFLADLVHIHYSRNDKVLERGNVRVRGDVIEIYPAYEDACIRVELFGSDVDLISKFDPLTGEIKEELEIWRY